jgi:tetratricopeptide (TPR) repeat protein
MTNKKSPALIPVSSKQLPICRAAAWLLCLLLSVGTVRVTNARTCLAPMRVDVDSQGHGQEGPTLRPLELGKSIEEELKGGESDLYQITLTANQYLQVLVEQRGIDVRVALLGPAGQKLMETNGWKAVPESLWYVSDVPGDYRIEVSVPEKKAAPGRYEVKLVALRAPTEEDRSLAEAMRLFQEARGQADEGKFDEAVLLVQRTVSLREKALGPTHLEVAQALNLLGRILQYKGEPLRGEPFLRRALVIEEQELGPDHLDVAVVLNDLANISTDLGSYAEAEQLFRRALAIRENRLGASHVTVATILNNLGGLYSDQGNYVDAELLFQRALPIWEEALGPNDTSVAALLNNLARIYRDKGDYAQAETLFRRALISDSRLSTSSSSFLSRDRYEAALALSGPLSTIVAKPERASASRVNKTWSCGLTRSRSVAMLSLIASSPRPLRRRRVVKARLSA